MKARLIFHEKRLVWSPSRNVGGVDDEQLLKEFWALVRKAGFEL